MNDPCILKLKAIERELGADRPPDLFYIAAAKGKIIKAASYYNNRLNREGWINCKPIIPQGFKGLIIMRIDNDITIIPRKFCSKMSKESAFRVDFTKNNNPLLVSV